MYRILTRPSAFRVWKKSIRSVAHFALFGAVYAGVGCSSTTPTEEDTAQARLAIDQPASVDSCGYEVTSLYHSRWHGDGFLGLLELKNVSGDKAMDFEVFADLHGATPSKCLLSDCEAVEGGYMFTPPNWFRRVGLRKNGIYPILFMSRDAYEDITPYVISINGIVCDQVAPTVTLDASGSFYTAGGTLTLTATASDNVAVKKVTFSRDGQVIATDMTAPYTLDIPTSASENGRHRYTATAYDMSGNSATSGMKSVLTGIGNKFFGTAAASAAEYTNLLAHFNQVTPGNAGKWGSVEAVQDQMNWTDLDTAYQFAKTNHLTFKLHTLVWGQQQPSWVANLAPDQQLAQIEEWMTALAERYPDVDLIDVVNEPLHAPPAYAAALGGAGTTGWDWVIKAFEMARAHFPKAELLLNDYSILGSASATQNYVALINLLKERGLIDGIGEQGHFYERTPEIPALAANLDTLAATGLPIYISELDINFSNDARQANRMRDVFTTFWSHPSVLGITHWGYLQGYMWRTDAYLVRTDGTSRPALTWIECYKAGGTDCPVPTYVPDPRVGDDSGITLEAEDYDTYQGLQIAGNMVAYVNDGAWLGFSKVVFNDKWNALNVDYARVGTNAVNLSVHLDSLDNPPIATVPLPATGDWTTMKRVSIPWVPMIGQRDIFFRFNGGGANTDKISFSAPPSPVKNIDLSTVDPTTAGTYDSATKTLRVVNKVDFRFKLPNTLASGQALKVHVEGVNNGTVGFRSWLVDAAYGTLSNVVKSSDLGVPSGNFSIDYTLTATGNVAYLYFKGPSYGTNIDDITLKSVIVTYPVANQVPTIDLSTVDPATAGTYDSATKTLRVVNKVDFRFLLPKTLASGQALKVHVEGVNNGTVGFRTWLVDSSYTTLSNIVKSSDLGVPSGNFSIDYTLTATGNIAYLYFKGPSYGTNIDDITLKLITVSY